MARKQKLYSTFEAAREVGATESQVRSLIRDGAIRAEMVAGRWVLDDDGLEQLAATVEEASDGGAEEE